MGESYHERVDTLLVREALLSQDLHEVVSRLESLNPTSLALLVAYATQKYEEKTGKPLFPETPGVLDEFMKLATSVYDTLLETGRERHETREREPLPEEGMDTIREEYSRIEHEEAVRRYRSYDPLVLEHLLEDITRLPRVYDRLVLYSVMGLSKRDVYTIEKSIKKRMKNIAKARKYELKKLGIISEVRAQPTRGSPAEPGQKREKGNQTRDPYLAPTGATRELVREIVPLLDPETRKTIEEVADDEWKPAHPYSQLVARIWARLRMARKNGVDTRGREDLKKIFYDPENKEKIERLKNTDLALVLVTLGLPYKDMELAPMAMENPGLKPVQINYLHKRGYIEPEYEDGWDTFYRLTDKGLERLRKALWSIGIEWTYPSPRRERASNDPGTRVSHEKRETPPRGDARKREPPQWEYKIEKKGDKSVLFASNGEYDMPLVKWSERGPRWSREIVYLVLFGDIANKKRTIPLDKLEDYKRFLAKRHPDYLGALESLLERGGIEFLEDETIKMGDPHEKILGMVYRDLFLCHDGTQKTIDRLEKTAKKKHLFFEPYEVGIDTPKGPVSVPVPSINSLVSLVRGVRKSIYSSHDDRASTTRSGARPGTRGSSNNPGMATGTLSRERKTRELARGVDLVIDPQKKSIYIEIKTGKERERIHLVREGALTISGKSLVRSYDEKGRLVRDDVYSDGWKSEELLRAIKKPGTHEYLNEKGIELLEAIRNREELLGL